MKIIDIWTLEEAEDTVERIRSVTSLPQEVVDGVGEIIENVRSRGDAAVIEYTRRFDGVDISEGGLEVSPKVIASCWEEMESSLGRDLLQAARRIESFASRSLPQDWEEEAEDGPVLGQIFRPLSRVGIYVPGGRYSYPSSVLMTGIPAMVAGVNEICICTPPSDDGEISKTTLAAIYLVKGARAFRCGGAQAIAAMTYGTDTIPRVDKIDGAGNVYVFAAKKALSRIIDQGVKAGPSEVVIMLDSSCDPEYAASDILAETEHDPLSLGVLVSTGSEILEDVIREIDRLGFGEKEEGKNIWAVKAADDEIAISFINGLAPEHLELQVDEPHKWLEGIESAGTVFLGNYSTAVLGDYLAGPSHVLPSGGEARLSSGLNVTQYMKVINTIKYDEIAFRRDQEAAIRLAEAEGMELHKLALEIRDDKRKKSSE